MDIRDAISEYPDFPKKGILFRDFGPALQDPSVLSLIADEFYRHYHPGDFDLIAGIESRGFIIAALLAARYDRGMIMLRKAGKLPGKTASASYSLEYGKATLEAQRGSFDDRRVLICDDLLATGGTAKAAAKLVEKAGGEVAGFAFVIELAELGGAAGISKYRSKSLVRY